MSHTHTSLFQEGTHFTNTTLLSKTSPTVSLIPYVDFEVHNPLGTSRKKRKHKITAVYWVLANVPRMLRSSQTSIYLQVLCKVDHIKRFGHIAVLEPSFKDLASLEETLHSFIGHWGVLSFGCTKVLSSQHLLYGNLCESGLKW